MRVLLALAFTAASILMPMPAAAAHGWHAAYVSQDLWPTLDHGETTSYTVRFRNTGSEAWVRGTLGRQANLGINGDDRTNSFLGVGWPTPDRPAIQSESVVRPGEIGTFTFSLRAPDRDGTWRLDLRPVIDAREWLEDYGVYLLVASGTGKASAPTLSDTVVQSGLQIPWDLAFAPDGRMLVTERKGDLRVYAGRDPGAALLSTTRLADVRAEGEAGLMSVELDPSFASTGLFYVCVSVTDEGEWRNQVRRYRLAGNTPVFDAYVIRRGMSANSNHNGCRIRFGHDGRLWVGMGDRGMPGLAQDPNSLNGKVLRVNSDGSIPGDNPVMPGAAGRTAVYTMGNRNPQGLAFRPTTGAAFEIEHGDSTHDEINILFAGANFGYPNVRGPDGPGGYADPAWSSGDTVIAPSGGDFVTGSAWGSWDGSLFVAQLRESDLRRFEIVGATAVQREILLNGTYGRIRTARLGPDGSLYLTTSNGSNDRVIRVTPSLN